MNFTVLYVKLVDLSYSNRFREIFEKGEIVLLY